MKAAPSDQLQILDIQGIDFLIATLENKAKALPEIAELLSTNQRLIVVRDLEVAAETQIGDIKKELLRAEADVEQVVVRLEKDEKRLADSSTQAKELEKLQHEVETLSLRKAELEEVELEIMLRIDSVKERLAELKSEEEGLLAQVAEIGTRKEMLLKDIDGEISSLKSEREMTARSVDKALMDLYEKIRANSGTGAAALKEGRCDGCHLAINSVELSRMKTLSPDEVVRCEECRCILVRGSR